MTGYTLQVTHHISPDLDAERDFVVSQLAAAGMVERMYEIPGVGPTLNGHNGGGDRYFTDGEAKIVVLPAECKARPEKDAPRPGEPWQTRIKDAIWSALRRALTVVTV